MSIELLILYQKISALLMYHSTLSVTSYKEMAQIIPDQEHEHPKSDNLKPLLFLPPFHILDQPIYQLIEVFFRCRLFSIEFNRRNILVGVFLSQLAQCPILRIAVKLKMVLNKSWLSMYLFSFV